MKSFDVFFNFAGNCREALAFYSAVFQSEVQGLMTYGEAPESPDFPIAESDRPLIMYACIPIFGSNAMFCDAPTGMQVVVGSNIAPTLGSDDQDELRRIFNALCEGGEVDMPLEPTFFSPLFGSVKDKFGILWQLSCGDM